MIDYELHHHASWEGPPEVVSQYTRSRLAWGQVWRLGGEAGVESTRTYTENTEIYRKPWSIYMLKGHSLLKRRKEHLVFLVKSGVFQCIVRPWIPFSIVVHELFTADHVGHSYWRPIKSLWRGRWYCWSDTLKQYLFTNFIRFKLFLPSSLHQFYS